VTPTGPAIARLAALGLIGCILQLTAVAQITVFGVPADLSPLMVVSVGLLMGSVPGRCSASASGCSSTPRCCRRSGSPRSC
jgi:hypothetical protein